MQNQLAWQITAHRVESPHRSIYALGCCDLSTEHGDRRLPPLQLLSPFRGLLPMCLAIPAQVIEILEYDQAIVDMGGVRKPISTALLEEVAVGDYVIVHVGYALNRLDPDEAAETLRLFAEMAEVIGNEISR
jgi:hydrogenase expression/formation protein HypC